MGLQAKIPTPKAMAAPNRVVQSSWTPPIFGNSNRVAPSMAGMDRRKENFPESSRSRPQKSPVEMVAPALEIPGMMANPWAIPIIMESIHPILSKSLPSFFAHLVNQSTEPVMRSIPPTTLGLEKSDSNQSLKKMPMRPVGMVAMMIQRKSFAWFCPFSFLFNVALIP